MPDDRIREQQDMNRETLEALQAEGLKPGDPLAIDLFWLLDDEEAANALLAELTTRGLTASTSAHTKGWFKKRTSYVAEASVVLQDPSPEQLDELVDEMTRLGDRHGAEFDGWGAEVPPD